MESLYNKTSFNTSQIVTKNYSTSFYLATGLLDKKMRDAIYAIYGFVRFADEIVDTFHEYDKQYLLNKFESDYYEAFKHNISLNPVLHSFQHIVKKYNIEDNHIQAFLKSMRADLNKTAYTKDEIDDYIYGSADVVGLMCLKVFCEGDEAEYKKLVKPAMKLGSAFQKVNFLRDLKNDLESLNRTYFPGIEKNTFDENSKKIVIKEIEEDFNQAYKGIKQLPKRSKLAVLIAYYYYNKLLLKIKRTPAQKVIESRIRISNFRKLMLILKANFVYKLNLV